ncbi:hypothetical protein EDB80DRAFT_380280 [Ilyonectria destructans]|nr:hypothetical protein EDB80DRAFT_380280 [Ilyonectria destructans]
MRAALASCALNSAAPLRLPHLLCSPSPPSNTRGFDDTDFGQLSRLPWLLCLVYHSGTAFATQAHRSDAAPHWAIYLFLVYRGSRPQGWTVRHSKAAYLRTTAVHTHNLISSMYLASPLWITSDGYMLQPNHPRSGPPFSFPPQASRPCIQPSDQI